MNRIVSAVGALVLGACFLGACNGATIPAGDDTAADSGSECSSGEPGCGGAADAGDCCPAGYDLYACTFPDGGAGQACHNPQLGCASSTTCGMGCDPVVTGRCGGGGGGDAAPPPADGCPGLGCFPNCPNGVLKDSSGCDTCQCAPTWFTTCGYPVCGGPEGDDAGAVDAGPACPAAGSPCSQVGETCGVASQANCGVTLVCATDDPKRIGCPISSKKYKDDIEYVDGARLQQLHDEALSLRLATYRYKPQVDDPGPTHLGFLIEDNLQTPAVDTTHHRVDMYGYLSMVVAGMQVQEQEIAQLRRDLEAARRDLATCKAPRASRPARTGTAVRSDSASLPAASDLQSHEAP